MHIVMVALFVHEEKSTFEYMYMGMRQNDSHFFLTKCVMLAPPLKCHYIFPLGALTGHYFVQILAFFTPLPLEN